MDLFIGGDWRVMIVLYTLSQLKPSNYMSDMDELFKEEKGIELKIEKKQYFEEIGKICLKVLLLLILFYILNIIGEKLAQNNFLIQGGFNSDILYSVLVLPLLYSLKDAKDCLESVFIKVWKGPGYITVKRGFLNIRYDKLYIDEINNIELTRSFCGKFGHYCSIDLYAMGGFLRIPYLKENKENFKVIEELMTIIQHNNDKGITPNNKAETASLYK